MLPALQNLIYVGAPANGTHHFETDNGAAVQHEIAEGWYTHDTLRTAVLTAIRTDIASARMGLSSTGHWTFDSGGAGNFDLDFIDVWFARIFSGSVNLTGASSYLLARKGSGIWYPGVPVAEHDPQPESEGSDTKSHGGAVCTTVTSDEKDSTVFRFVHVDNVTELVSPAGAYGTTYVGSGITDFTFARDKWWSLEDGNEPNQGFHDGRRFRYFADRSDAAIAIDAALGFTYSAGDYSTWVAIGNEKHSWKRIARPVYQNRTILYDVTIDVIEYTSPT